ncbi:hypothetical protein [Microcystis phage Mwe-JY26]
MRRRFLLGAAVIAVLALAACSDAPGTVRAAEAMGLREVKPRGYTLFGCSKDDFFQTRFEAIGSNGQRVSGVACRGILFKGTTIRLD